MKARWRNAEKKSEQEKVGGETDNNPEDISEDRAHLRRGIWEEMRRETPAELLGLAGLFAQTAVVSSPGIQELLLFTRELIMLFRFR